jgi:hypothetical protein
MMLPMQSCAATLFGDHAWMTMLPAVFFLWRKKRAPAEDSKKGPLKKEEPAPSEGWLYVGRDDDGTPLYVDIENLSHDSESGMRVRMWVKYRPRKQSQAFKNAQAFLGTAGKSNEPFDHIRQKLEIDFTRNMVGDLELVFHGPDGRAIESVKYHVPEWRRITPGSVYELLQKTADGTWKPDRFPTDPELRAKVQEKLREINKAFEAFETVGE